MIRLKRLRLEAGLSQEQLGYKSRTSFTTINRIEGGRKPKNDTLRRIARALGVPVAEQNTLLELDQAA